VLEMTAFRSTRCRQMKGVDKTPRDVPTGELMDCSAFTEMGNYRQLVRRRSFVRRFQLGRSDDCQRLWN